MDEKLGNLILVREGFKGGGQRGSIIYLSDEPDILYVQHQVFGVFKGQNTLFSKIAQKLV